MSFDAADGFVDNELFISEEHFAELSKEYGVPKADDIVITAIGTIGNAHVVRECDRFYFKDASVLWMKRTAEVSSEFVNLWLKSPVFFDQLDLDRSPVFYPDSFATEHSRYVLEEGDIIMSLTGTTGKEDYGFAVRIPDCGHTLLMNQRIMKFDAIRHDIIDDGYLLHYLRSRSFLDILYPTANGTRQANLSSVTMKLLPVPLRSLKEQKATAAQLDALSAETQRLARLYERKLAALEALKKALLHQASAGEL